MKQYRLFCLLLAGALGVAPVAGAQTNEVSVPLPGDPVQPAPQPRSLFGADQQSIMNAADAGDAQHIRSYVNFTRSAQDVGSLQQQALNLEFTDQAGNTPLIRAAARGHLDAVRALVEGGANLNAQNARWETPLVVSYNNGYFEVTRYLLSMGAADPYNTTERMRLAEQQRAAQRMQVSSHASKTALYATAAGVVAAGAGLGIILNQHDPGGTANTGNGIPDPTLNIDCGAGTSTHPEACDHADFVTAEAAAQEGVLDMKADYALSHGYDGRIFNRNPDGSLIDDSPDGNVLIAEIDTGVDLTHTDLDDNLRADLAVTCTTAGGCVAGGTDQEGHGTNVAGIMVAERNGIGMHGVAPRAKLVPIAAIISGGSTTSAFAYANSVGAQVINNSWGLIYSNDDQRTMPIIDATGPAVPIYHPTGTYAAPTPAELRSSLTFADHGTTDEAELQAAVAAGRIIVFSAGNDALNQPGVMAGLPAYFQGAVAPAGIAQVDYNTVNPSHYDWSKHWVAAISLADNNTISSFSHECGIAKNWCLAAPGEIASTTKDGGGYEANNGTSFSAPNISGAIAVMLGAFPQLAPDEVLQILFDTATDLGDPGVDDVYGHGLVNLENATDPTTGGWTLSVHGSGGTSSFAFAGSGFSLSSPFGKGLHSNASIMFQDAYNKDYLIPLSMLTGSVAHRESGYDKLNAFDEANYDNVVQVDDDTTLGFSQAEDSPMPDKTENRKFGKFSYQTSIPMGEDRATAAFNYHANMADAMEDVNARRLVASDALKNPYLNMVESASSSVLGYESGHLRTRVGAYSGTMNGGETSEYQYRFAGNKNVTGVVTGTAYGDADNNVEIENGVTIEENSFLGAEAGGAFGVDRASTYYGRASGRLGVLEDVSLLGAASLGYTDITATSDSLFSGFNGTVTSAFALGIEKTGTFDNSDRLGFIFSQPLRVMRSSANMTLPADIAADGTVIYRNQRVNLAPDARELDFETYYNVVTGKKSSLSMNALLRLNPDNDNTAENDLTLLGKYKWVFN